MKTIEQIQAENRKFILEAIHGCSYEEALEREIKELGCLVDCDLSKRKYIIPARATLPVIGWNKYGDRFVCDPVNVNLINVWMNSKKYSETDIILGRPLTLNRVLLAININMACRNYSKDICFDGHFSDISHLNLVRRYFVKKVSFDLAKETLEEQSEETQRVVNKIFTVE